MTAVNNDGQKLGGQALRWTAVAVASLVIAVAALFQWSAAKADVEDRTAELDEWALLTLRVDLSRAQLGELNRLLLEVYVEQGLSDSTSTSPTLAGSIDPRSNLDGEPDQAPSPSQRWEAEVRSGLAAIEEIAQGEGPVAVEAELLMRAIGSPEPGLSEPDFDWLSYTSYTLQFEGAPNEVYPPTPKSGVAELVWVDEALTLTLKEAVVAMVGRTGVELANEGSASYLDEAYEVVLSFGGGYLGDPADGFADSLIPLDGARMFEREVVDEVADLAEDSNALAVDRWLLDLADDPDAPFPGDVLQYAAESERAAADIQAVVDARVAAEVEATASAADSARMATWLWLVAALVGLLIGAAAAFLALRSLLRHTRNVRKLVSLDPLTGVGNRNVLTQETATLLYAQEYEHHLLVTIDLDRFKVINDTYGHPVGDRVLVRLATGLRDIAAEADERCTVVRLGGDEFLISFHSDAPIDVAAVQAKLRRLRCETVPVDGVASVLLEFSFGLAGATGSPPLSQLLDASDLAAYEEKAVRRDTRSGDEDQTIKAPPILHQIGDTPGPSIVLDGYEGR